MQKVPRRKAVRLRVPARRALAQGIAFIVTLLLFMFSGCAGGWEGSKPASTAGATITSPQSQTVTVGQTATFAVSASGTGPFTYQWYKDGVAISGATSSTYMTPATVMGDSGSIFTVVVTGPNGAMTSTPATLTVNAIKPAITTQPATQTVTSGQTATFTVTATGTGPLSYQWYENGVAISGATGSTYTTPPTTNGDNGAVFTVTVSNSAGSVTSTPVVLSVSAAAPIAGSIVPSSATPPYKGSVNLVPTFSGGTAVIGSNGVGSSDITRVGSQRRFVSHASADFGQDIHADGNEFEGRRRFYDLPRHATERGDYSDFAGEPDVRAGRRHFHCHCERRLDKQFDVER